MASPISADLRRRVAERAEGLCEYCLIHEDDTLFGCQVDHIVSLKHGGSTTLDNLAYACVYCNRFKGTDIGSVSEQTGELVRFYNPRLDRWGEHFSLDVSTIRPLSPEGEVTAKILGFNTEDRIIEREALRVADRYPSPAAKRRMGSV